MKYVILSYLHPEEGAKILLQDSGIIEDEVLSEIPNLLNSHNSHNEQGFFIHRMNNFCSGNYIFFIPNDQLLQISIIVSEGSIDADFTQELLTGFQNEAGKIEELYKALDVKKYDDGIEKFNALRNLVLKFGKSFPEENVLQQGKKNSMVFIFGLDLRF